jgi:hypothetical protein
MSRQKVYDHKNAEMMAESVAYLKQVFPPGTEVRTIVKHVTSSGMGRVIDVLAIEFRPGSGENSLQIRSVGYHVARVLNSIYDNDRGGVWVTGCGMDMCFHLVYSLARALYGDDAAELEKINRTWRDAGYALDSRPL